MQEFIRGRRDHAGYGRPVGEGNAIAAFADKIGVPFTFLPTDIKEVVFDIRKEENPCALCANLRRGALNNLAKSHGCTKVALGHHREDVLETMMLSLFFEARLHVFAPVTYLKRVDLTIITTDGVSPRKSILATIGEKLGLPCHEKLLPRKRVYQAAGYDEKTDRVV